MPERIVRVDVGVEWGAMCMSFVDAHGILTVANSEGLISHIISRMRGRPSVL